MKKNKNGGASIFLMIQALQHLGKKIVLGHSGCDSVIDAALLLTNVSEIRAALYSVVNVVYTQADAGFFRLCNIFKFKWRCGSNGSFFESLSI